MAAMAIVLALISAFGFGAGDFVGGMSTKNLSVAVVLLWARLTGLILLIPAIALIGGTPSTSTFLWGAAAGVAGTGALAALYRGLAIGPMGVVSPITAVLGAVIPGAWSLLRGDTIGTSAGVGLALGLVAVVIVSRPNAESGTDRESTPVGPEAVGLAVLAGVGFALFFILVSNTGEDTGVWALVATQVAALAGVAAALAIGRVRPTVPPAQRTGLVGAGTLDMVGNIAFVLASRQGALVVVSVITALYPAGTIALARVVLGERIGTLQRFGVALAAIAVVLIAID